MRMNVFIQQLFVWEMKVLFNLNYLVVNPLTPLKILICSLYSFPVKLVGWS